MTHPLIVALLELLIVLAAMTASVPANAFSAPPPAQVTKRQASSPSSGRATIPLARS